MFDRELAKKIDDFVMEKFPQIYNYNFDGVVLVYGGIIRNMIMGLPVKDLDFVVVTQGDSQVLDFVNKFKLNYRLNAFGGLKIKYKGFTIDLFTVNDLLDAAFYDIDWLFYDIQFKVFISCGARDAINNRKITQINFNQPPVYANRLRKKKIVNFIKYITGNEKKVKIKEKKLLWECRLFMKRIRMKIVKKKN